MMSETLGSLGIKGLTGRIQKDACEVRVERTNGAKLIVGAKTLAEAYGVLQELFGPVRTQPVLPANG
jgi:hypothetical protein